MNTTERIEAAVALVEEASGLSERAAEMDAWVRRNRAYGKSQRNTGRDIKYGSVKKAVERTANVNRNQSTKDAMLAYVTGLSGIKRTVDAIAKTLGMKPAGDYPPKNPPRNSELGVHFGPDINKSPVMVAYGWKWDVDANKKLTTKSGDQIFELEVYID